MMTKDIFLKAVTAILIGLCSLSAQNEGDVDAIEKARQAKEAADKAAADAAAATEAAIEAAAAKAAKEAREEAKRKKEEEEARKAAEAAAAEEAELDAAAQAAAKEAKRKMAEELGLEIEDESDTTSVTVAEDTTDAVEAKESFLAGFNLGLAASVGLLSGETFTNIPTGGTLVITTPFGFKVGPFDYTVSLGVGSYTGNYEPSDPALPTTNFDPTFVGLGGNLTVAEFIFAEGHVGLVGEGSGFRGFAGITLERLMKRGLNLPFNLLVGSEAFFSTDMAGEGNSSGWASAGVRLDYNF